MKIFIKEYNYFSDIYEYSRDFVNRYIHLYGVKIRRVHNYDDFANQGIYHDPTYPYVHTIISNDPKNFKIPLYGDTFKVIDIIFTSKMKNRGGQAKDQIYIKADTVDLINIDKYKETLERVKEVFIHEIAHLYDRIIHGENPPLINKKFGGKYNSAPLGDNGDSTTTDNQKKWRSYLDQSAEINAFLNVALNEQGNNLVKKFKEILKDDKNLQYINYFIKLNNTYNVKNMRPSLKAFLESDYDISGKRFMKNVVYSMNMDRAGSAGVLYDIKHDKLYNLTQKQEKYIYTKVYPVFNKIYNYYIEKIIEKLKNIKYEN